MRSASAWATAVLPEAVGPKIPRTALVTEPRSGAVELVLGQAGLVQVSLDAPVAPLELLEHSSDRLGRRLREPLHALELLFGLGLGEPLLAPWAQAVLAERVVGGDLVDADAGHVQEKSREQPGAVLAARAVDDDSALRRVRDRPDRRRDVPVEVREKDHVDLARRGRHVRGRPRHGLEPSLDLFPVLRVRLEERNVQYLHGQLSRRIGRELVVRPQVDDRLDAVVDERGPALVAQLADAIGADDRVVPRLAAVLGRMAAEVADVEQPVPEEVAATLQRRRALGP